MKAAEILDKTFSIFKKSFWIQMAYNILINIMTIPLVIVFSAVGFFMLLFFGISLNFFADISSMETSPIFIIVVVAICFFAALLIICIESVKSIGEMFIAKQNYYNIETNLSATLKNTFSGLFSVLSVIIAKVICFLPIIIIAIVIETVIVLAMSISSGFNLELSVLQIVICSIVPLIAAFAIFYFDTVWLFAVPIAAFEKIKFFKALGRSAKLTKGSLKQILGIRIIWFISLTAFNYAIFFLIYFIIIGFSKSLDSLYIEAEVINVLIQNFVSSMLFMITKPLNSILTFVLYYNQRIKNEGLDIQIKVENMTNNLTLYQSSLHLGENL